MKTTKTKTAGKVCPYSGEQYWKGDLQVGGDRRCACPGCGRSVKVRQPPQGGITHWQIPRHNLPAEA
ncbi:MAG: hypothetical protein AAGF24_11450 [Cyanobacteria bacterium P01_H01_bin.121]